ncbi:MAG TPA: glycosyltransferase family 2 protein [Phenylobacterium sp.]|nr:glycosyltransferase family 2 protein [Phenylobacterium sp.]
MIIKSSKTEPGDRASVSIIICTKDRDASLRDTLAHMGRTNVPAGWSVELLVVDNGSSDDTQQVVSRADVPGMTLRYVFEPARGKSRAFNTGVSLSSGQVLLMTDDDVHVPVNWIEDMCRPIVSGIADGVQGGIRPAPHLDPPWLSGILRYWVAVVEDPEQPPEGLVGANMAISRRAFEVAGPCDPRLGPGAAGNFEDTVLGWAMREAGMRIHYAPDVAVEHHFDADRLTIASFMHAAHKMAASRVIVDRDRDPTASRAPLLALFAQLPGLVLRGGSQLVRLAHRREPDARFFARYYRFKLWQESRRAA